MEIPLHLIGDAVYPLKKWLMKEFNQHLPLTHEQAHYNNILSSAKVVVENAFSRLKGRWRCLLKRNDFELTTIPNLVAACCILHNLCEMQNDYFLPEWNTAVDEDLLQPRTGTQGAQQLQSAQLIRNTMADNLEAMLNV